MRINLLFLKKLLPVQISISALVAILNFSGFESKVCYDGKTVEFVIPVNRYDCVSLSGLIKYIFNIETVKLIDNNVKHYVTSSNVVDCSLFIVRDIKNTMRVTWLVEQLSFIGIETESHIDDILSYSLYFIGCYLHKIEVTDFYNICDFESGVLYPILIRTDYGIVVKLNNSVTHLGSSPSVELSLSANVGVDNCIIFLNFPIGDEYFNYIKRIVNTRTLPYVLQNVVGSNVIVSDTILNTVGCILQKLLCANNVSIFSYVSTLKKFHYVYLRYVTVNKVLGYVFTDTYIETCLRVLACYFVKSTLGWLVSISTTRLDLCTECVIIDELIRHYSYASIRKELPNLNFNSINALDFSHIYAHINKVRLSLSCCGYNEVITYSFVFDWFEFLFINCNKYRALKICNPLSNDLVMMRTSLLPSLLLLISRWSGDSYNKFKLYEIGNCFYVNSFYCVIEVLKVTGVCCATVSNVFIEEVLSKDCFSFYEARKDISSLTKSLGYTSAVDYYVGETTYTVSTNCFILRCTDVYIGITGLLSAIISSNFNIKRRVFFF